ncbi:MAG: hypothetical protein LBK25_07115 [Treponema sp.]|nr:hypothetical protein [Treponema sp.]
MAPVWVSAATLPNNEKIPLVYKRNRQDGDSGSAFRTTTCVKSSNTPCVSDNNHCEVV